jgi:serine/threonine-protein kinase RsbW
MSICWSLHLRREAASVPLARRLFLGTMEAAGVDAEISYELAVALTEACANAVEHGEGEQSDAYEVTARIDGDRCHVEVVDTGPGFPSVPARAASRSVAILHGTPGEPRTGPVTLVPFSEADHGRGMHLIETLADHVLFANRPDSGGAMVSFDRMLKWRDDALLRAG